MSVHRLARIRQAEAEQVADHALPGQTHRHVPEVGLGLHPGTVRLRNERLNGTAAGCRPDLTPAHRDVVADHAVGDGAGLMLLKQPVEDAFRGVSLLARRVQINPQHLVNQRLVGIQAGLPRRQLLARPGPGRLQCVLHGGVADAVLAHHGPLRHPSTAVPTDRRVQLDPRSRRHRRPLAARSRPMLPPQALWCCRNSPTPTRLKPRRSRR